MAAFTVLGGCAPTVQLAVAPGIASDDWSLSNSRSDTAEARPVYLVDALGSAQLGDLVAKARRQSPQIAIAAARVSQARGALREARSSMLPAVALGSNVTSSRDRQLGNTLAFDGAFGQVDINYGLDIWGRDRALNRASLSRLRSNEFNVQAVSLAMEAELVRAYVSGCTLNERIAILDRNIERAEEVARIVQLRRNAGEATRVELGLQTIQVAQLRTERLRLLQGLDRVRSAIAVLAGEEAPGFHVEFVSLSSFNQPALARIQPRDLLTRRPDLQAAEQELFAANADVVAARAAFLPRIDLSARALIQSAGLSLPLSLGSSISADLLAPIFNRRRLHGELETSAGRQIELANLYRATILNALAETEDAISAYQHSGERQLLITQIVAEARETARLARMQYLAGDSDIQELMGAESFLASAEDAQLIAGQERLESAIIFAYATGGSALIE